ncbi:fumarylacetoacetate hydrolase family protein [Acinetobacter modestus]|uniref:fumarylacetoacetate hydrolase family protein n=1 Tax=Acinetobacter modestus TaxID=1776740 RepID=UPI00202F93DB|nr:fumarylacetoacetate hydrolase family protein [Acinetobacter modestus]MCM1958222.1 fumarylacetoacetate hydrolase family protein [Acinetobacter modestus]
MSLPIIRFQQDNQPSQWGVIEADTITPLNIAVNTTSELIKLGYEYLQEVFSKSKKKISVSSVILLSPITTPSQVLCQGANYRQHMIDSGMDPDAKSFNMFFTKSSASITKPVGQIIKPKHVNLLDYEIELTLVLGKDTDSQVTVTEENLHEYIAGICIGNDVSARDIQIPQMQFYKGKSYRTFCPLGPVLCLLDKTEMHYLSTMLLKLKVNGEIRQQDSSSNLVFKPAETLTEFSMVTNFNVGDILMTGTPSGCALGLPPAPVVRITGLLPENMKWQLFNKSQSKRSQYLQVGDLVEAEIISSDGKINLGVQKHHIVSA